jgi:selenocysteine-specific elongation factor
MSDSNLSSQGGLVVGTAGHIDHGKTTLVHALTGMNTDTLKEEQRRGISIDLGFAKVQMPDGAAISFIDVPGHERFIKNMLAGAGGIEAVLLVVAADESVKPQTREHFDICRLLGIRRGLVVLTKSDLASAAQLEKTCADVRELVARSFLENAPVIPVSAVNGAGIPELRERLAELSLQHTLRDCDGLMRLPVDRSFARKGFGAVVTGTLLSGELKVGDAVQIYPQKKEARVRGLQVHHAAVSAARAGQRVAVNLAGVEHTAIRRGHVVTVANMLETTRVLDVSVDWLDPLDAPVRRQEILFHSGTSEVSATIKMNEPLSPHTLPVARLRLAEPLLVLPGDRFVLRRPSPARTVAGGCVIDAFPPRRLNRVKTAARLNALSAAPGLDERIRLLVGEHADGLALKDLVRMTGAPLAQIQMLAAGNAQLLVSSSGLVLTRAWLEGKRRALVGLLRDFHAKNAGAAGAPLSMARMGLEAAVADLVFSGFTAVRLQGDLVALSTHQAAYSAADMQLMQKLEAAFRDAGFQPPAPAEAVQASAGGKRASQLLEILIKSQRLTRISAELVFHSDVIRHIRQSLGQHKGRRFGVTEFKSWMNISRKYAIPLLEYLDNQRITKREGDMRVVL